VIVDTGLRVRRALADLQRERPRSLAVCALLDRKERRLVHNLPLAYIGFTVPDTLLAGYGLGGEHGGLRELRFADGAAATAARRRHLRIA
jgi:hypoxanthine phosphoribosyltransferase